MKTIVVERAMKGDKKALESILKEQYQQLYKTAFLYVRQESDALDIVQDAVVKIIKKIHTLDYPEYFSTWAVRIVIFTALDHLKRNNLTFQEMEEDHVLEPDTELSHAEQLDIYEGIRRLPQHLQEITILHYFLGKKLTEISEVSGEPLGTVKYKIFEARKKLKQYLEEEEE